MEKRLSEKHTPNLLIAALALCLIICILLFFYLGGYTGSDAIGHWRICKYTLEGYNPYTLINTEAPIESVGMIPPGFSTVPWSCVFGSAFYAGFLPLAWACGYILILHFLALGALILVFYRKFKALLSRKQIMVLLMLPCVHFSFMYSVHYGNAGAVICCLLMMAFCVSDDHPIAAGILMGFAMMKPQISAILCLVYLLKKQWKVLFTAAAIVIAGWVASSVATATSPIELLLQTLESGTAAKTQYLGLLNNLKYFGIDSKLILLCNMLIGCVYTLCLFLYLKRRSPHSVNSLFVYVPACIASTFWIYKNGTDYLIIAFAAIFFCLLCMNRQLTLRESIASIVSIGYLQMSRCAVYLGIVLFEDNLFIRDLFKSADGLILALLGIYLCRLWVKYSGDFILFAKTENE